MTDTKKPNIFGNYFKKLYFIPTIIFAVFFSAVLYFSSEHSFVRRIGTWPQKNYFYLGFIVLVIALTFAMIWTAVKKSQSINDANAIALIITSALYAYYHYFVIGNMFLWRIVLAGYFALLGLVTVILSIANYNNPKVNKTLERRRFFPNYFRDVNYKYPMFITVFIALCFSSLGYLLMIHEFSFTMYIYNFFPYEKYVFMFVCAIPVLLFLTYGTSKKEIGILDQFIEAALFASILYLIQLIVYLPLQTLRDKLLDIVLACLGVMGVFLFTLVRMIIHGGPDDLEYKTPKNKLTVYVNQFNKTNHITLAIASGSVIAFFMLVIFRIGVINKFILPAENSSTITSSYTVWDFLKVVISKKNNDLIIRPSIAPYLLLHLVSILIILAGIILPLIKIASKKVNYSDFLLILNSSFGFFGVVSGFLVYDRNTMSLPTNLMIICGSLFIFSTIILIIRIHIVGKFIKLTNNK